MSLLFCNASSMARFNVSAMGGAEGSCAEPEIARNITATAATPSRMIPRIVVLLLKML
jgi:hypothetical protein